MRISRMNEIKRPTENNYQNSGRRCHTENNCERDRKDRQRITAWCGHAVCFED